MPRKKPEELRSHRWFGAKDLRSFGHRSRMLQMGYAREEFQGKPVIAVINTWSEMNCCHTHSPATGPPRSNAASSRPAGVRSRCRR